MPLNLVGQQFGNLVVLREAGKTKWDGRAWLCHCACERITIVGTCKLNAGHTQSCGCQGSKLRISSLAFKHGYTECNHVLPEYNSWANMIQRCGNVNHPKYKNYGGRGIKVCERWQLFSNFLQDMGEKPNGNYSIDRINNNGNYEPSNCKWSTAKEQANNTRRNIISRRRILCPPF